MTYIPPASLSSKFTCPLCGAIAKQRWAYRQWGLNGQHSDMKFNQIRVSTCDNCSKHTLWLMEKMLHPDTGTAPNPNPDMPTPVVEIYQEAASIASKSPRGAAALLRLALQVLVKELGEKGKNINSDIASLVAKGLPERVQQALDIVRVTGNNSVHPGQIEVDNEEVVGNLFELLNIITEYMISMPKKIGELYGDLPQGALEGIQKRDNK